jgi:RNA-directed DNA polymerase
MDLTEADNLASLAVVLNCSAKKLGYYIYKIPISAQYKQFTIPKKRGGTRTISAPASNLKIIQRNLARELSKLRDFKPSVNGFVSGRNIKRNATSHVAQRYLLNIDLEDFFGSINFGRVYGLLSKPPYSINKQVAAAIAKACTLNNVLPQGAPSSPVITNLICAKMDSELVRLANALGCRYSRYADDLTFSTTRRTMPLATNQMGEDGSIICELNPTLRAIVEANGFRINEDKTRLRHRETRQEVTGLIVNRRINVKRSMVRQVRAMLHAWRKFGLAKAQEDFEKEYDGRSNFESSVRGKIEFIGQIRERPDVVFKKLAVQYNKLSATDKIRTVLTPEEVAKQATWVIESDTDVQGTAFFVEKYGLVTCAHCIGANPYIYHPADPAKKITVKVMNVDSHRDLAVLDVPSELKTLVPIPFYKGAALKDGTEVILFGYPNHYLARPVRIEQGKLIRTFPKSAVMYLEITPKIIGGNSGGPLLNNSYELIGLAVLGLSGSITLTAAEFFAVSATELVSWLK